MKITFTIVLALFFVNVAYSDTAFRWANSLGVAEDINSVAFASAEATVFTFLDFDITSAPSYQPHSSIIGAFQVDIADIPSFIDFQDIVVAPFGAPPPWGVATNITESGSGRDGQFAYAIVVDGGGLSSISIGNFVGAAANSYEISDSGAPASTTQLFNPGIVQTNIQIIPEPTTFALMLVSLLGLLRFRKNFKK